jgi:hypothetical protein
MRFETKNSISKGIKDKARKTLFLSVLLFLSSLGVLSVSAAEDGVRGEFNVSTYSTGVIKARITNNAAAPVSGAFYLAVYNDDGVLVDVEEQPFAETVSAGTATVTFNTNASAYPGYSYKVYAWDSDFVPLANAAEPDGINPYGYGTPNALYIVSAVSGKVLTAPIGADGLVTVTPATAAYAYATSDYDGDGDVPVGSAYKFVLSTTAATQATAVGLASAVYKASGNVAWLCSEGHANNKFFAFSRTTAANVNPSTAGMSATAWEGFRIQPNGDGTVSFVDMAGNSYAQIAASDNGFKMTAANSGNTRAANINEKFILVPTALPAAPNGLVKSDVTPVSVQLKWAAPLNAQGRYLYNAGYRVYREQDGAWVELTSDGALAITKGSDGLYTYTDDAPSTGVTNRYKIAAASAIGDSVQNPEIDVVVPASAPPEVKADDVYFSSFVGGEDAVLGVYLGYGSEAATGISSVVIDGKTLVPGQDYMFSGTELTIFAATLGTIDPGSYTIDVKFNNAAATTVRVPLTVDAIPASANALIVSAKTGKLVGLPATAPNDNTLIATYSNPADTRAQWQIKFSNTGNGIAALRNISNNNLATLEDNTWGDYMVRARTGNKDALTGGWECVAFVPAGDGKVKIKRVPSTIWITVRDDGNLMTTFNEAEAEAFTVIPPGAPSVPSGFALEGKTGYEVSLSWNNMSTFAAKLSLLRSKDEGATWTEVDISSAEYDGLFTNNKVQFTDTGLELNTAYRYKFVAENLRGVTETAAADVVKVSTLELPPPVRVTGLKMEFAGDYEDIKLTWDAIADPNNFVKYNVYRSANRYGGYTPVAAGADLTAALFVDADIANKYAYYKVAASNSAGEGALSEPVSYEMVVFGDETYVFGPQDDILEVNKVLKTLDDRLVNGQIAHYTEERAALLFKPGNYGTLKFENGFYMHTAGLGKHPLDTKLSEVTVETDWLGSNNATQNFWRSIENLTMTKAGNIMYGIAQATPMRRLNLQNATTLQLNVNYGWASGGFLVDSFVKGAANGASQQQFYYRNDEAGSIGGVSWNLVTQGVKASLPTGDSSTNIESTPVIYEKPFLYYGKEGADTVEDYYVFVPARRENAIGMSWSGTQDDDVKNPGEGASLRLSDAFYIATPEKDTAATINAAINDGGKNLFLTPGVYRFSEAIEITRPNTIVLAYGLASIIPTAGNNAMNVADVPGVKISGIIFDAGPGLVAAGGAKLNPDSDTGGAKTLLRVGTKGTHNVTGMADNPVVLQDLFVRVGGVPTSIAARADIGIEVNSDYAIIDHLWVWRADHGDQVGWDLNKADYGVVVNGNQVLSYGLFVEHFQKYDVLWTGDGGRVYFLQNEKAYDVPYQADWMSPDGNGWASFKVADGVVNFEAWGLGCYDVFIHTKEFILLDNAMVTPLTGNIKVHKIIQTMISAENDGSAGGGMKNVINGVGAGRGTATGVTKYGLLAGQGPTRVMEWSSAPLK